MADLFRKAKSLYSSTSNSFSTGSGETITLNSVSGLPTDTEIILTFDRVDADGTETPTKLERIIGTVTGSSFVVRSSPSSGRGADGTTEQAHTSPVVEYIPNAKDVNDLVDGVLAEHSQDGSHTDITASSIQMNGTVQVTQVLDEDGLASNSSTSLATQQSIKAYVDATQASDGWILDSNTWTYASATSFTISGTDVTDSFPVGTKIKLTQTSEKYFVVISSSFSTNTTVNITGGDDYSLANATIASPYYSYQSNPQGFPQWFDYTPSVGGFSGTPTVGRARFSVNGGTCLFHFYVTGTSNDTSFTVSTPIASNSNSGNVTNMITSYVVDAGAIQTTPGRATLAAGSNTINLNLDMASGNWTGSGTKEAILHGFYQI